MDDYRTLSKIEALRQAFPGKTCENPRCEELCAEAYNAAKTMHLDSVKVIQQTIKNELHCRQANQTEDAVCRFGFVIGDNSSSSSIERNITHVFRTGVGECKVCKELNGIRISPDEWADEAVMQKKKFWIQENGEYLPHPHCKCHWEKVINVRDEGNNSCQIKENVKDEDISVEKYYKLLHGLKDIWEHKVPKPPRVTDHSGSWLRLTEMWFFEEGPDPIYFDESSPYSCDIAKSYSIQKEVKDFYIKNKSMPPGWSFTGPKTANGTLGEVEWFLGSYNIQNVREDDTGIHFTVYNVSSWHSGTRLPQSWTNFIKDNTGFEIYDLVSSAPRGETMKTKIRSIIPGVLLYLPWVNDILSSLPSFGGNWTQYYNVVVRWDD